MVVYSEDHDTVLVPWQNPEGARVGELDTDRTNSWADALAWRGYIGWDGFVCPTDPNPVRRDGKLPIGYAMFRGLEWQGLERRLDRVVRPGDKIMVSPNSAYRLACSGIWEYRRPDAHRHAGYKAMYAFCDGHSQPVTFKDMFGVEYNPEWSYSELWELAAPGGAPGKHGWSDMNHVNHENFPMWAPWMN
jgi:prepilin-type processing-associated H-X9-DG protein